jgi:hypothetical protein
MKDKDLICKGKVERFYLGNLKSNGVTHFRGHCAIDCPNLACPLDFHFVVVEALDLKRLVECKSEDEAIFRSMEVKKIFEFYRIG